MKDPLEAFLDFLKYEKMYSEKTLIAYEKDISEFMEIGEAHYGTKTFLSRADRKFFRRWLAVLNQKKMARSTIQRKISAVKSFFRFLNEEGIVDNQAYDLIIAPKKEKKLPDFLSQAQVMEILDSVDDGTFEGKRDRAILELLYSTGVRLNELLNIRFRDINFRQRTVKVTGKGSKDRVIPVGETAIKIIKEYMEYRQRLFLELKKSEAPETIFVTSKGKPLYPMAVQRMVRKQLYEHAGLFKLNPHIFRHSFATHMLDNGADIRAVKDLLGHESLATTQHYTHVSVSKLKKAYEFAHPRSEEDGV